MPNNDPHPGLGGSSLLLMDLSIPHKGGRIQEWPPQLGHAPVVGASLQVLMPLCTCPTLGADPGCRLCRFRASLCALPLSEPMFQLGQAE